MTLNRYNPKRDANEPEIIHGLRKAGCWVTALSGTGIPDLLCCSTGILFLVEVKMPGAVLTPKQRLDILQDLQTAGDCTYEQVEANGKRVSVYTSTGL